MDEALKQEVQKLLAGVSRRPKSRFSSLTLKVGASYAAMALFTIAAIAFFTIRVYSLNGTARQIVNVDLPVLNALTSMRASLLAQENFAAKYSILKDPDFVQLFEKRKRESMASLAVLEAADAGPHIATFKQLYLQYERASDQLFAGKSGSKELQTSAMRLISALDALYIKRQNRLLAVLKQADADQKSTIRWAVGISCVGFALAVWIAPFVIYRIIRSLDELQKATHRIAQGDFHYDPQMPAAEEIRDLASDFNEMAARILEMEQMNNDTLPLTRLPGNLAIERVLDERLRSGTPFAFCHASLVHFKAFRAQYGYAKAGELLRSTGYVIAAAVNKNGAAKDFAGHMGGEDFVLVVSPDKVAPVCEAIIKAFDDEAIKHYEPEDQIAGGFQMRERYGAHRFSPITTVSISVMNCSVEQYSSAVEISRAAADAKEAVKTTAASNWEIVPLPEGKGTSL